MKKQGSGKATQGVSSMVGPVKGCLLNHCSKINSYSFFLCDWWFFLTAEHSVIFGNDCTHFDILEDLASLISVIMHGHSSIMDMIECSLLKSLGTPAWWS